MIIDNCYLNKKKEYICTGKIRINEVEEVKPVRGEKITVVSGMDTMKVKVC